MTTTIAPNTFDRLSELESRAEQHRASAIEFWKILTEIQHKKLYRPTHSSFAEYVRARWNIGKSHAYRQLTAAKVAGQLSPKGENVVPKNEAAARALRAAPASVLSEAVREATTAAIGPGVVKVSAEHVRKATRTIAAQRASSSPSRPPTVDGRGKPVTDPQAAQAFAAAHVFAEFINQAHSLKRGILRLAGTSLGREVRAQHIERAFRDIVEALSFATPFAVCPLGANCTSDCKYCKGSRWIHKEYFKALPQELRS
jgi:hypothetical protein